MPKTITFTSFDEIHKYLTPDQRAYVIDKADDYKSDLFIVAWSMLHNDGPDVRATLIINEAGLEAVVTMPLTEFMKFRKYTPTTVEEDEAAAALKAKDAAKAPAKGKTTKVTEPERPSERAMRLAAEEAKGKDVPGTPPGFGGADGVGEGC